jgi:hypothetical protein
MLHYHMSPPLIYSIIRHVIPPLPIAAEPRAAPPPRCGKAASPPVNCGPEGPQPKGDGVKVINKGDKN